MVHALEAKARGAEAELGSRLVFEARLARAAEFLERDAKQVARRAARRIDRNRALDLGKRAGVIAGLHADRRTRIKAIEGAGILRPAAINDDRGLFGRTGVEVLAAEIVQRTPAARHGRSRER